MIGVHLPFESQKDRVHSKIEYESSLSLISTLIDKYNRIDIPCLILGDFNADTFRKKKFDDLLGTFITEKSLIPLDLIYTQKIDFTYYSFNNFMKGQSIYKANLDHFLFKSCSIDINFQCNIIDDVANTSDHRSLTLDIFL